MEKATKEQGITLIALIITIIVMLILVGVTVSVALNGGLFKTAKDAVQGTDKARIEEEMQGAILEALDRNGDIDLNKLKQDIEKIKGIESVGENFPLSVKDKNGNQWIISTNGEIKFIEPEVEKIIAEDDPEANYWKTDGEGTIIYYEVPEGVEIPETLIVPSQIGDEKITKISELALCGVRVKRDENGNIVMEQDEEGDYQLVLLDTEVDENEEPIPTGQATKINNIIISKGIESIGSDAIAYCTSLKEITLPSSLKEMNGGISSGSDSLTVRISEGTTEIFDEEFAGCRIKNVILPDTITRIGDNAFFSYNGMVSMGYESILTTINIPESVTYIGEYAFAGCTKLTDVGRPKGLVTIGRQAFHDCTSLKTMYVPETVDNMGYAAFRGWTNNQTIEMGKIEEPVLESSSNYYTKIGWEYRWKYNCNANIVWGK